MRKPVLMAIICFLMMTSFKSLGIDVTGVVSAPADGPLPGVSVVIKGSTVGTITDFEGKFKISVPDQNAILVFSTIGFLTQEIAVGNQTVLNVVLVSDTQMLNEVVVTALGISREKKSLGFSQQEVSGEALTESRTSNVVNGLSGKIAGVRITSNGGLGSGSNIQIRGASSVSGNNQPLIVINGVPMQQTSSVSQGGGISEINPDDIKDMSVLKGPNAAALYGSRAANGVILITTKDGSGKKGLGIDFNSNFTAERPFISPNFQDIYGGGNGYRTWYSDGRSGVIQPDAYEQYQAAYGNLVPRVTTGTDGTDESWGAPMDGRLVRHWWSGTEVAPLTPNPGNFYQFFQTGTTLSNSIAFSGSNSGGNFRLAYGRMDQQGLVAFNDFKRDNVNIRAGYNLTKWLKASASGEYIKTGGNRTYNSGSTFIWSQRQTDWDKIANWRDYVDTHIQRPGDSRPPNWQHTFFTNPIFSAEMMPSTNEKDRLLGNMSLTATITDNLKLMLRSGTDLWTDTRINVSGFQHVAAGTLRFGAFSEEVLRRQETNHDFLFSYDKLFSNKFSFAAQAGGAIRSNYYKRNQTSVAEMIVDGVYNLANSNPSRNTVASAIEESQVQSLYGSAQLGFRNAIFLDLTARNDWSSTLPINDNSFFYPSASVSAVLSDLINITGPVLSFAKIRGSWAQVGNDADPYQLAQTFRSGGSWNASVPQYYENTEISNATLKPEITTGIEFGADLRFFHNKIGLDVTYYDQTTKNQILGVEISRASGYARRILNAGKVNNHGIEITLSGKAVETAGFKWETSLNFARNRNKVLELAEGLETYTLTTSNGLTSLAAINQPYGTLVGMGFARTEDGQMIYRNGLPILETTPKVLGNVQPDWTGGFSNTFSYKSFSLTALIDVRMGGDLYDQGTGLARFTGQYEETAVGREEGIIGVGVKNVGTAENPVYVPNDIIVPANQLIGYNNARTYHEAAIFDGSYVKLREVSLGYKFNSALLRKAKIQNAKLSLVGRNVLMLFRNHPHIDPEVGAGGGNAQGFVNGEIPSTRSLGFNLSLGF
jgi:TonB-linked SusC/RagA family outer membrane protein